MIACFKIDSRDTKTWAISVDFGDAMLISWSLDCPNQDHNMVDCAATGIAAVSYFPLKAGHSAKARTKIMITFTMGITIRIASGAGKPALEKIFQNGKMMIRPTINIGMKAITDPPLD
jgi:hypothetical protein